MQPFQGKNQRPTPPNTSNSGAGEPRAQPAAILSPPISIWPQGAKNDATTNYYSRDKKMSSREGMTTVWPHSCLLLRVPARQRAGRSLAGPRSAGACTVMSPPVLRGKNTFMTDLSLLFLLLPPRSQTLITNSICLFHAYQAQQNQYLPDISQHKISLLLTSLACLLYPVLSVFFLNTGPEPYDVFLRSHHSNAQFPHTWNDFNSTDCIFLAFSPAPGNCPQPNPSVKGWHPPGSS